MSLAEQMLGRDLILPCKYIWGRRWAEKEKPRHTVPSSQSSQTPLSSLPISYLPLAHLGISQSYFHEYPKPALSPWRKAHLTWKLKKPLGCPSFTAVTMSLFVCLQQLFGWSKQVGFVNPGCWHVQNLLGTEADQVSMGGVALRGLSSSFLLTRLSFYVCYILMTHTWASSPVLMWKTNTVTLSERTGSSPCLIKLQSSASTDAICGPRAFKSKKGYVSPGYSVSPLKTATETSQTPDCHIKQPAIATCGCTSSPLHTAVIAQTHRTAQQQHQLSS